MLTSSKRHTIRGADKSVVQIDYTEIREAAAADGKTSLALAIYERFGKRSSDAPAFLKRARWVFAPDPAHMVDTSAEAVEEYVMVDQERHSFVMDGEHYVGRPIGVIESGPAKEVAMHTYSQVKQLGLPAFYTVSMPERVYQRIMFPFVTAGKVTHVVTLVHPLLSRRRLSEVLH